jgi:hypothetical protein
MLDMENWVKLSILICKIQLSVKCNFKVLKYSKPFVISEYIEAFPKRTKMHSGGAHIEYYTPSELLFGVKTNVSFPHKFSHSWKKKLGKISTFFSC